MSSKSYPLREVLLLEIIRNTIFQNQGFWLFVVIQQLVLRILLMNKEELY